MGIQKNILIDGKKIPFKASAAVPRLYRLKFGRDIYMDFEELKERLAEKEENEKEENEKNEKENYSFDVKYLEIFENIAYIMAKHADPDNVPETPDEWLENFSMFSIYVILPQLINLWNSNNETQVEPKKKAVRRKGK